MNYDDKKHIIEYIEGSKIKQFEVPEKDYNLKFDKMSYNDVIMYIKLTKEEEKKSKEDNTLKYKPLKTVAARTKDYFAQDIKLMSQNERLKKIAEFLVSGNIQELKEFLSSDVFNDDPIIKSVMKLLNNKGYTYEEIKTLMKKRKEIDLYSSEIENCIVKDGETRYSFEDITFKNTLNDLLDLSKQINVLQEYTIFVPIDNPIIDKFERLINFDNKQKGFTQLNKLIFGEDASNFNTKEGRKASNFLSDNYFTPSIYYNNVDAFVLPNRQFKSFSINVSALKTKKELKNSNLPLYFYSEFNNKIYLNLKILYYLLQFNNSFKNNNYKFVVEKLKNGVVSNVILIAGSAFDLDNIIQSLQEKDDKEKDYYEEYTQLMSETITKFFDKQFTPIIYRLETKPNKPSKLARTLKEAKLAMTLSESKPQIETTNLIQDGPDSKRLTFTDETFTDDKTDDVDEVMKEGEGLNFSNNEQGAGVFSFRRDTKETLQLLLNRIIKLENKVESQHEQIKELKLGIKSINQSLPDDKRKEVFGNYFSNSLQAKGPDFKEIQENGALNPDKVYPKITFSEFRKLYNKL